MQHIDYRKVYVNVKVEIFLNVFAIRYRNMRGAGVHFILYIFFLLIFFFWTKKCQVAGKKCKAGETLPLDVFAGATGAPEAAVPAPPDGRREGVGGGHLQQDLQPVGRVRQEAGRAQLAAAAGAEHTA